MLIEFDSCFVQILHSRDKQRLGETYIPFFLLSDFLLPELLALLIHTLCLTLAIKYKYTVAFCREAGSCYKSRNPAQLQPLQVHIDYYFLVLEYGSGSTIVEHQGTPLAGLWQNRLALL